MLIKSQDGKVIVNTSTLVSLSVYDSKIYCTTTNSDEDYGFIMGEYDTNDEAQSELDKLYDAVEGTPKYDLGGYKKVPDRVDFATGEIHF